MTEPPAEDLQQTHPAEKLPPEAKDPLVEKALATFDDTEERTKKQVLRDAEFQTVITGGVSGLKSLPEIAKPEPDTRAVQENAMKLAESVRSKIDKFASLSQGLKSTFGTDRETIAQLLKSLATETDPEKILLAAQKTTETYAAVVSRLNGTRDEQRGERTKIEEVAEGNRAESIKWRDGHPDSIGNKYYMGSYTFAEHVHQASSANGSQERAYVQENTASLSVFKAQVDVIVSRQSSGS